MILAPLREVIINKSECEDLVNLLQGDPELKEKIVQHLHKTYGANFLFIFDGFDELSAQQRNVQSLFLDIIKGSQFHRCSVLVTSRPYASGSLRRMKRVNRHIEVL